ncbi:capsid protein [Streptococcus sp. zg-86]|uniref:Capsid protein n=1 Tax=Streptococcus zhangguiae TaxID=2664091 RepID=A0A6I4RF06_9STRE|nr:MULTISPECIES: capsid protein [unclassified Streptococcus]MTB64086.1 capsid protein [Streptococcus sp. zg-86]MTB90588.1 capsid protein [Streptococcus sp. zg-36]MWV56074.1 capsid protein [Streptococcus sp. zg-70]QTH48297.1 capsid protein [Streptococcus sp. zg-86]
MTVYNYVEQFRTELQQKYARELTSHDLFLSNPQVTFMNAQTIKLPSITVSGYKDHSRATTGYNSGNLSNEWEPKKLEHDRDIEFAIDPMDVDETNLILAMANIQNTLETEQGIPEKDSYIYSKLYQEATTYASNGATVATDELTAENILTLFDDAMEKMDEASVPAEGRVLYVTPAVNKLFKQAKDLQRVLGVTGGNGSVNRSIYDIDDVTIKVVPSARMKTKYNYTDGCVPASDAKQMNFILIHPSCVIAREKYSYIKVFTPGHDSRTADNYLLQSRFYMDAFLIKNKATGIYINAKA